MKNNMKRKFLLVCGVTAISCMAVGASFTYADVVAEGKTAIHVTIDTLSYETNDLPNGVVGKTYPVFACEAKDNNGNSVTNIDVLVYDPLGKLVPIKNERFDTQTEGTYTLVYKATYGAMESITELWVEVVDVDKYEMPYYEVNDAIVSSSNTGAKVYLPDGTFGGGIGDVKLNMHVDYEGAYNCSEIAVENYGFQNYFVPTVAGEYIVTYTISDIVGTEVTKTKEILVEDSLFPIMRKPAVSLVATVGEKQEYTLTEAVVYRQGKEVYVPVKVYVDDTEITDTLNYVPQEAGVYTLRYEATNIFAPENSTYYEYEIQVNDTLESKTSGLPYVNNYLNFNGLSGAWRENVEGVENDVYALTAEGTQSIVSAQFKKAVPLQYASFEFGVDVVNGMNFDNLYCYYTDSVDGEKIIAIQMKENDKQLVEIYVNGRFVTTLNKTFTNIDTAISASTFCFEINRTTGTLIETTTNTEIVTLTAYMNGEKYDGFSSGKVYLTLEADGVDGECGLKLYNIAGQTVASSTSDRSKPVFVTPQNFTAASYGEYGKPFTVKAIESFDIYDTEVDVKVKITASDRTVIYEGDISADYTFIPNQYGRYQLEYSAIDSAGNERTMNCVLRVVDREAPSVATLKMPSTIKVGEELSLPAVAVTDNHTQNIATWVYVTYGNYQRITVMDGKFKCEKAGTYVVKYGAEDDDGNITVVTYTIVCK